MSTPINTEMAMTSVCISKRTVSDCLLDMLVWNLKLVIKKFGMNHAGIKISRVVFFVQR